MSTRVIKPPARLEPRNSLERRVSDAHQGNEQEITYEQLKAISIFKDVKYERVDLRALPDTIVLRRFAKDEVICDENDPGYTAFYVLTSSEIEALRLPPIPAGKSDPVILVTRKVAKKAASSDPRGRTAGTADMWEGELFGEMSCLYRVPRSATVRAVRDCYVLEFLRNVLDKINTGSFRKQLDDTYRERFFELHLRNLEFFRKLGHDVYEKLREEAVLLSLAPGALIIDEHDRKDGMYIILRGFVKIVKNQSALVGRSTILDWQAFLDALDVGSREGGPRLKLALLLKLGAGTKSHVPHDLLYRLNDLLKTKDFAGQIGFDFTGPAEFWADEARQIAAAKNEDPERIRRFNRQLLESLYPKLLEPYGVEPVRVLGYRSAPEWAALADSVDAESSLIGEIGIFDKTPRTATCIAYGQSDDRYGGVQLVYISKKLFFEAIDNKEHLKEVVAERQAAEPTRLSLPAWQQASVNAQFDELGLIQGQKLMLIDLDRCTRCDKCVEACVESHSPSWLDWLPIFPNNGPRDGRSRLFLEGPRLQLFEDDRVKNYLVPSTCRQCKDAVCLIGCPVGSIHKGDNGQIVIEDWCIGCSRCAVNCPYNAIQMHTVGVIPRATAGWSHRQSGTKPIEGATPFRHSRDFVGRYPSGESIEFARRFELTKEDVSRSKTYLLQIESAAEELAVKINGQAIALRKLTDREAKQKGWNYEAMLAHLQEKMPEMLPGEAPPQPALRSGRNEVVVELTLASSTAGAVLLDVGLIGYLPPVVDQSVAGEEYKQDWVMKTAVVCDMCSGQFGKQPACVTACPHDAAERRFVTFDTFMPARGK